MCLWLNLPLISHSWAVETIVQRDAVSYAAITGVRKHLSSHYWFVIELKRVEGQSRLTEGISVLGQRLIKQRGTFAPALLTNLSPVKMTAGEAWHCPRPYAKSPFRLLCTINSQNGLSVYSWAFWRHPSKSYGYAIMSWGGRSIFVGLFYHYILNKRFIVSRQGKKNAKVKDTGRVKYIAMERRTPLVGAKAAICVYPSRSAVSESCQGSIIHQSTPSRRRSQRLRQSDYKSTVTNQVCFIERNQENNIYFLYV